MEKTFTTIYENGDWGNNMEEIYSGSSGSGSSVENTKEYVTFLRKFIINNKIKTVSDLGSGDWQSSQLIYNDLDVQYNGYDVYKKVIEHTQKKYPSYNFYHLDIYNNPGEIKNADLFIMKDILQHWTCEEINNFLNIIIKMKKFKYLIICNCRGQKKDNQDEPFRSRALSAKFLPLKKYNFKIVKNFLSKEISLLTL